MFFIRSVPASKSTRHNKNNNDVNAVGDMSSLKKKKKKKSINPNDSMDKLNYTLGMRRRILYTMQS